MYLLRSNTTTTPPTLAGLFFCLASTRCWAFISPCCNTAPYNRLQRVLFRKCKLYRPRHKTARRALQALFLRFAPFCRHKYQTDTSGYNTTCATLERITAPQHLQRIPDTNAAPDAVQLSTAALLYNKVYKDTTYCRPCQPGGLQSGTGQQSGRTGWHAPPGGAVQKQGRGGRRGTIGGYRRISFRAFAR